MQGGGGVRSAQRCGVHTSCSLGDFTVTRECVCACVCVCVLAGAKPAVSWYEQGKYDVPSTQVRSFVVVVWLWCGCGVVVVWL